MYETSCTCEILHWTPHIHRLKLWTGSLIPAASWTFFYHLGHNGFELYTCACWTLLTHTVLRSNQKKLCTGVNISFNIRPKNSTFKKKKIQFIYTGQIQSSEGTPAWSRGGEKKRNVLFWFAYISDFGLLFYEANSSSVIYSYEYFYEVCYWSELHIYFVNHECLCYKFVYFNNKCHTKQKRWYKIWIGYFKAFGPLSLEKLIYGTIHIFYWNIFFFVGFLFMNRKKTGFGLLDSFKPDSQSKGSCLWHILGYKMLCAAK